MRRSPIFAAIALVSCSVEAAPPTRVTSVDHTGSIIWINATTATAGFQPETLEALAPLVRNAAAHVRSGGLRPGEATKIAFQLRSRPGPGAGGEGTIAIEAIYPLAAIRTLAAGATDTDALNRAASVNFQSSNAHDAARMFCATQPDAQRFCLLVLRQ